MTIAALFDGLNRAGPGDATSVGWAVGVARTRAGAAALHAEVAAPGYRALDACGLGRKAWAADYELLAARLEAVPTGAEYGHRLIVAEPA